MSIPQRGNTRFIDNIKTNLLKFKPVTPKSLSLYNVKDLNSTAPELFPVQNLIEKFQVIDRKRVFTADNKQRKTQSPVPEFAKEYVQEDIFPQKLTFKQPYVSLQNKSKPRILTSKPIKQRISITEDKKKISKTSSKQLSQTQERKVSQLYKPQILYLSPRSKIRIYSTINIGEIRPQKSPQKNLNLILKNLSKPHLILNKPNEETCQAIDEPIEYIKPALTFGEKLWRLNEVSIVSMISKQ